MPGSISRIDSEATLYVIEVKKGRTPREVVAQALDYGYWVSELTLDQVAATYAHHHDGESFEEGFRGRFDDDPPSAQRVPRGSGDPPPRTNHSVYRLSAVHRKAEVDDRQRGATRGPPPRMHSADVNAHVRCQPPVAALRRTVGHHCRRRRQSFEVEQFPGRQPVSVDR